MIIDVLNPYLRWIKVAFLLLLLLAVYLDGVKNGKAQSAAQLATKDKALTVARMQLSQQAQLLAENESRAAAYIAAEKSALQAAEKAGKIAEKAEHKSAVLESDFVKRLKQARKAPDCEALLAVDVRKICGL